MDGMQEWRKPNPVILDLEVGVVEDSKELEVMVEVFTLIHHQ